MLSSKTLCLARTRIFFALSLVIFQIDQKVEMEWPLTVMSRQKEREMIFLKPGKMLFYESAKIPHGRQFPLNGEYFDNLFIHFHPIYESKT